MRDKLKSEQNTLEILVKKHIFRSITDLQPADFPKSEIHYRYFSINLSAL